MNQKNVGVVALGDPKNQRGITLIALVITIIVLLILAGVTINMVLGDDGIIANAQQAAKQHEEKSRDEIISLAQAEAVIHEHTAKPMTLEEIKGVFLDGTVEVNCNGTVETFRKYNGDDGLQYSNNIREVVTVTLNGEEVLVPIPVEFAILKGEEFSDGCYAVDPLGNIYKWYKDLEWFWGWSESKIPTGPSPWKSNYGGGWCVYEEKETRNDWLEMSENEGNDTVIFHKCAEDHFLVDKEHYDECDGYPDDYCPWCSPEGEGPWNGKCYNCWNEEAGTSLGKFVCADCEAGLMDCPSCWNEETGTSTGQIYCPSCWDEETGTSLGKIECTDCEQTGLIDCLFCGDGDTIPSTGTEQCGNCLEGWLCASCGRNTIDIDGDGVVECAFECGGTELVDCPSCEGGQVPCSKCNGSKMMACILCNGDLEYVCWECEGAVGPCLQCNGAAKVTCYTCNGNFERVCEECNGDAICKYCYGTGENFSVPCSDCYEARNCPKCFINGKFVGSCIYCGTCTNKFYVL